MPPKDYEDAGEPGCYRHLLLMLYPLDPARIIGAGLESRDWTEPRDGSRSGNNATWRSAGRAERRSRCTRDGGARCQLLARTVRAARCPCPSVAATPVLYAKRASCT